MRKLIRNVSIKIPSSNVLRIPGLIREFKHSNSNMRHWCLTSKGSLFFETPCINATMSKKTEKEKYSFFLFSIGEAGREIFNTWIWPKVVNDEGEPTDEDDITIAALFKKFEDYCKPKRNLIVERYKFNTRRQNPGESVDHYITELKTLAASCEYGDLINDF